MLVEVFGEYPQIKVLEYLLSTPFVEHTKLQIAVGSDISRITLDKFINKFLNNEILIKEGNKYLLNLKAPLVQNLNIFVDNMNRIQVEKDLLDGEEDYDELSEEELGIIFDENASDVDLKKLEEDILYRENSLLFLDYLEDKNDEYKLIFANDI